MRIINRSYWSYVHQLCYVGVPTIQAHCSVLGIAGILRIPAPRPAGFVVERTLPLPQAVRGFTPGKTLTLMVCCLAHRIRMYAIYGNIYHQYTPVLLPYIPYIRILWVGKMFTYMWKSPGFLWENDDGIHGGLPGMNRMFNCLVVPTSNGQPWPEKSVCSRGCTMNRISVGEFYFQPIVWDMFA